MSQQLPPFGSHSQPASTLQFASQPSPGSRSLSSQPSRDDVSSPSPHHWITRSALPRLLPLSRSLRSLDATETQVVMSAWPADGRSITVGVVDRPASRVPISQRTLPPSTLQPAVEPTGSSTSALPSWTSAYTPLTAKPARFWTANDRATASPA
jgi:hypothetical protein